MQEISVKYLFLVIVNKQPQLIAGLFVASFASFFFFFWWEMQKIVELPKNCNMPT